MIATNLIESDIVVKIQNSDLIDEHEKQSFIRLIMYMTPSEIEELKLMI